MTTAITYAALRTLNEVTPRTLVLPAPESVTFNQGIEEMIINETNDLGEMQFVEAIVQAKNPALTVNYGKMTREIMALKMGYRLQGQALSDALFAKSFRVLKNEYPAAAAGQEGYGMSADQSSSECFRILDGLSVALTRQEYATFDPATPNTFAQGANGAFKFSNNLITERALVTPFCFYPVASGAQVMTDDPFSEFQCTLIGVITENSEKKVFELKYTSMQLNKTDNNDIDFRAVPIAINFRITDLSCHPRLRFLDRRRVCQ